jgi:hypothetical protein
LNSLKEMKAHTKGTVWVDTLRTTVNSKTVYGDKFIQKIFNRQNPDQTTNSLCLKGKAKIDK